MTGMEMSVADILGLRSQKVENWCTTETMVGPLFLSPSASLQEIIENFYRLEVSALVVKEGSKLVGIVSEHDVICSLKHHGGFSDVITAESIMSGRLVTIRRDQTCAEAVSIMKFVTERRLQLARNALQSGDPSINVSTVRFSVGIESESYFSKIYNRRFGELPSVTLRRSR